MDRAELFYDRDLPLLGDIDRIGYGSNMGLVDENAQVEHKIGLTTQA